MDIRRNIRTLEETQGWFPVFYLVSDKDQEGHMWEGRGEEVSDASLNVTRETLSWRDNTPNNGDNGSSNKKTLHDSEDLPIGMRPDSEWWAQLRVGWYL